MKMYKKVMAAALAGVMTVSMSATAFAADDDGYILKATNEDSKSSDNDLVIAIEGSVSSMDPANIPDTNAISATRGVYETLVSFDENQELTGKLAESWEVSDDSLTYTFKLRQGVKFQDGTDFNAAAVKANYDRVVNKDNNLRQRRTFIVTNEDGSESSSLTVRRKRTTAKAVCLLAINRRQARTLLLLRTLSLQELLSERVWLFFQSLTALMLRLHLLWLTVRKKVRVKRALWLR